MNSPILLLVAWFVINIIIKSAKDKGKIEEARRKRAVQLENMQPNLQKTGTGDITRETLQRDVRKSITTIKNEIEKQRDTSTTLQKNRKETPVPDRKTYNREGQSKKRYQDKIATEPTATIKANRPKTVIELKEDIIKGIIFSEILSKPKSIQNLKRAD